MSPELYAKVMTGLFGFVAGACVAMIIGFVWGGWTTATTTQKMNDEAVLASRAVICVAQFKNAANYKVNLKEFQKTESYERSAFIEKGSWDKMPGQDTASWGVSGACVTGLEALGKAGT